MEKNVKKEKKINKFKQTFALFDKEKPDDKYLPIIIMLRGFDVVLTAVFALCLGVFVPLCIIIGTEDPEYAGDISTIVWLISSALYTFGIFVLMLGNTKTAVVIHCVASIGTLITFFRYMELFKDVPNSIGPVGFYMPCLGITVLTVTICLLTNIPRWRRERKRKQNEKAPSILDDK